ncbi:CsbD family protein [Almyronema epifaneia]|uniref:CsbD family protein n=1 Tax=Almyronema epifaneia S1 TaxID=2991925 RepID=A0ABW6IFM3_9CYAN
MKTLSSVNRFAKAVKAQMAIAIAFFLAVGSVLVVSTAPAMAAVGTDASRVAPGSQAAAEVVQDRAKREADRMLGAGTSNKVEGAIEGTVGKAKRQANDFGTQVEGAAEQAEGKVKRDVGRAKSTAETATDKAGDAGESLIDSIKDFFN